MLNRRFSHGVSQLYSSTLRCINTSEESFKTGYEHIDFSDCRAPQLSSKNRDILFATHNIAGDIRTQEKRAHSVRVILPGRKNKLVGSMGSDRRRPPKYDATRII